MLRHCVLLKRALRKPRTVSQTRNLCSILKISNTITKSLQPTKSSPACIPINLFRAQSTVSAVINRAPKCSSCGVILQSYYESEPGFYLIPKKNPKKEKEADKKYDMLLNQLSKEDQMLLSQVASDIKENIPDNDGWKFLDEPTHNNETEGISPESVTEIEKDATEKPSNNEERSKSIICRRCHEASNHSLFNIKEHPVESVSKILKKIPYGAQIIYVISAIDFPMSIDRQIVKSGKFNDIIFVITKSDMLFMRQTQTKLFGQYFTDFMKQYIGASRSNVLCVSGTSNWGIEELVDKLSKKSYFIGEVNSGKSTLINSILLLDEETRVRGSPGRNRLNKRKQGPGISFMPSFTRDIMEYKVFDGARTIVDVPGFSRENHGVFGLMSPEHAKVLSKGVKVYKTGKFDSKYEISHSNQCFTSGGYFYLIIPSNTIVQIRSSIPVESKSFSNIKKATDSAYRQGPEIKHVFNIYGESAKYLRKFQIPDFTGVIDLVIKNVGFITIKPTGPKNTDQPFEVYLPEGVEAVVRSPISDYIFTTLSDVDKNGNPVAKADRQKLAVKETKKLSREEPVIRELIPVTEEGDIEDIMAGDPSRS